MNKKDERTRDTYTTPAKPTYKRKTPTPHSRSIAAKIRKLTLNGKDVSQIVTQLGCTRTYASYIRKRMVKALAQPVVRVGTELGGMTLTDVGGGSLRWVKTPIEIPVSPAQAQQEATPLSFNERIKQKIRFWLGV